MSEKGIDLEDQEAQKVRELIGAEKLAEIREEHRRLYFIESSIGPVVIRPAKGVELKQVGATVVDERKRVEMVPVFNKLGLKCIVWPEVSSKVMTEFLADHEGFGGKVWGFANDLAADEQNEKVKKL